MTTKITHILSDHELSSLVTFLQGLTKTKKVFAFSGTLGAGKTTLIQSFCRSLGVTEPIQSPTYTYMNIYHATNLTIYHFDLYRLTTYQDFLDAGFDEYLLLPNSICLIEWPEIILPILSPESTCSIDIDYYERKRCYTLSY